MKSVALAAGCAALGLVDLAWIDVHLAPGVVGRAGTPTATASEVVLAPVPRRSAIPPIATMPPSAPPSATAPARAPERAPAASEPSKLVFHFDVDAITPLERGDDDLDAVGRRVGATPGMRLVIDGHTDRTGPPAHNERLSRSRAEAIAAALVAHGVDPSRISSIHHGPRVPVARGEDADSLARNRRVEVRIERSGP
jgi:outer membrane protein OmpA-like peptidoglycan-associated protein